MDHWAGSGAIGVLLRGKSVSRCYVDYAFGVQFFDEGDQATIRIEGRFTVRLAGAHYTLSPDQHQDLGHALDLLGKSVEDATATEGGELVVRFTDRTELVVPPGADYEAWELVGPGHVLIVSLPGGGLACWNAGTQSGA